MFPSMFRFKQACVSIDGTSRCSMLKARQMRRDRCNEQRRLGMGPRCANFVVGNMVRGFCSGVALAARKKHVAMLFQIIPRL